MTRQDEDSYRRGRSPFRLPARRPLLARLVPVADDDPQRAVGLASLLALLVGAVYLVARLIRLGWVAVDAAAGSGPGSPSTGDGRPPSETGP